MIFTTIRSSPWGARSVPCQSPTIPCAGVAVAAAGGGVAAVDCALTWLRFIDPKMRRHNPKENQVRKACALESR